MSLRFTAARLRAIIRSSFGLVTEKEDGHGDPATSPYGPRSLHELVLRNSQFIIATHSPIIMAYPHARIYECTEDGLQEMEYTDTQHYRVTFAFMNRREQMLRDLLSDADER